MKGSFKELIKSDKPVLVDFFATWCGPCKAMQPVLKDLAKEVGSDARIIKIDVDKNPKIAQAYQIQSIPTMILFKNGEALWRTAGMQSKGQLKQVIQQYAEV